MRRIDSKGFKEFHQKRLDEKKFFAEKKLQEEKKILKEQKKRQEIKKISEELRYNWRDDIDLQESNWSATLGSGPTNSIAQRFAYSSSNLETGQPNTVTVSGLGGVESIPSTVTVDFGFGETEVVSAPTFSQLGLQGYAKPLGMDVRRRRDYEDVNPRLDASQEFARAVGADYMMNARVDDGVITNYTSTPDAPLIAQVIDGEKLLPQELQDILNRRRNKSPALGGTVTTAEKKKIAAFMITKDAHDLLINDPDTYDRLERALTGRIPPRNLYPGKTPQPQDSYGDFLRGGGMINPSAYADALGSISRTVGDSIADALGVKDAKDVFDYYMKWSENPNDQPVNLTNKISPEGLAYLQKLAGDPSLQGMEPMRKEAELNQLYVRDLNNGSIPLGLRNILGMPDVNKGDGFKVDKNGKTTVSKAYDFTDTSDTGGTSSATGIGAMVYARTQGIGRYTGAGESPTMNMTVDVAEPSYNAKANKGFALDPKTGEPRYTGLNDQQYSDAYNKIADKYNKLRAPIEREYAELSGQVAPMSLMNKINALNDAQTAEEEALAAKRAAQENSFNDALQYYNDKQNAENKARQDALDEIDNEKNPHTDRLDELNAKYEKLKREGKLIKGYKILGPGDEGYTDYSKIGGALDGNRKPIYTAAATKLYGEIQQVQKASDAWQDAQQKKRDSIGGQGGLPIGTTTLRGGAGSSAGARKPTPPENMSQSAALARQAASARMNPQQRRKKGMKESTTWSRLKKYR